jgi:hypothetical protein
MNAAWPTLPDIGVDVLRLAEPCIALSPDIHPFDTMNAGAQSIGEKCSFSAAWNRLQLCLIPCKSFFEPCYETEKAVR